jgi:predicted metal-dependent phosphoesterase TrpH
VIDLHCHSTRSDGSDAPSRLAELAAAAGLSAVALTDHDTVAGFAEFEAACEDRGIRAVRGAEISCRDDGRSVHVLCYFISEDEGSALRALLRSLSEDRAMRNEVLLERLGELGYTKVTAEAVAKAAGPGATSVGRPHFAAALLELYPREFASRQAIFDDLLGTGGRAYVPKARVSVADASRAAAADGAVTVLAHPLISLLGTVPADTRTILDVERVVSPVVERLAADGLGGVEAYYSRHDPLEVAVLVGIARRHGLVATGGSDYHGTAKPDISLGVGTGSLAVPDEVLDELEGCRPR